MSSPEEPIERRDQPSGDFERLRGELPATFALRRPRRDDLIEIVALCAAADIAVSGESSAVPDDLECDWGRQRFDLECNALVVVGPDGQLAAYAWVFDEADHSDVDGQFLIHPDYQWQGLEAPLLAWVERLARELALAAAEERRVSLGVWCIRGDPRRELYEASGFARTRTFRRMRIRLDGLPDEPLEYAPPVGIEVRRFMADRDERAVWAASEEAFRDHFRFAAQPFEEWLQVHMINADTDLWYVAWAGDEVAGLVMSYIEPYGGYVDILAVRRPWRRMGLGRLLLLTAFSALRERGCDEAMLGVDADNETGAVGIYERAGMRESQLTDFFEKELRPGR